MLTRLLSLPALVALSCAMLVACADRGPALVEFTGATMGTRYSVKVVNALPATQRDTLAASIDETLERINAAMSTYDPDSELSRFNASASTEWIDISGPTHEVLAEALRISRLTRGAFDVTVGPAVNVWGFGPDMAPATLPDAAQIDAARRRIGFALLMLRDTPPALRKARRDVYVDLSAIAKGYAVDRIAALLDERGIDRYLVEIGGELRARGASARDDTWRVAVERPLPTQRSVQRILPVLDTGMATSGNYRNFFERDGERYSHTIDPRTARPVSHTLASVTVLHPSAMTADALATAMSVLGTAEGLVLAERNRIAALFIDADGSKLTETASSEFKQQVPST
jgi:thiamine biosynthesis lipoprotein